MTKEAASTKQQHSDPLAGNPASWREDLHRINAMSVLSQAFGGFMFFPRPQDVLGPMRGAASQSHGPRRR